MTQKELAAVVAECAARTKRAAAISEEARAGIDVARKKQEESIARQEANMEKLEERWAEADARWEDEREDRLENRRKTNEIIAELRDARDERRAMLEALFRLMDRLPPPPPDLRSA